MSKETLARATERAARDSFVVFRLEAIMAAFVSLTVWGIGAFVCSWFHVSSYYALAVAVVLFIAQWRALQRERLHRYFESVFEELRNELSQEVRDLSARMNKLERSNGEPSGEIAANRAVSSPPAIRLPVQLVRSRTSSSPAYVPFAPTETAMERAVEVAVRETNATSLNQMGLVIKTARALLRGVIFDEKDLSDLVRSRLRT